MKDLANSAIIVVAMYLGASLIAVIIGIWAFFRIWNRWRREEKEQKKEDEETFYGWFPKKDIK